MLRGLFFYLRFLYEARYCFLVDYIIDIHAGCGKRGVAGFVSHVRLRNRREPTVYRRGMRNVRRSFVRGAV